jgi:hypothetical protein
MPLLYGNITKGNKTLLNHGFNYLKEKESVNVQKYYHW